MAGAKIGSQGAAQEFGRLGEKWVSLWASQSGIHAHGTGGSDLDGWDFVLECPNEGAAHVTLDQVVPLFTCKVHVKTSSCLKRSWPIKLSNLQKMAMDPTPWFVVVLIVPDGAREPTKVCVVHIGEGMIARILEALRKTPPDFPLHRRKLAVKLKDEAWLPEAGHDAFLDRLRTTVGVSHEYYRQKLNWTSAAMFPWLPQERHKIRLVDGPFSLVYRPLGAPEWSYEIENGTALPIGQLGRASLAAQLLIGQRATHVSVASHGRSSRMPLRSGQPQGHLPRLAILGECAWSIGRQFGLLDTIEVVPKDLLLQAEAILLARKTYDRSYDLGDDSIELVAEQSSTASVAIGKSITVKMIKTVTLGGSSIVLGLALEGTGSLGDQANKVVIRDPRVTLLHKEVGPSSCVHAMNALVTDALKGEAHPGVTAPRST